MKEKITFKEVPYNWEDEDALNHCDVGGDRNFEIVVNDTYTVGHLYISKDTETPSGMECPVYINWIELLDIFRNKGLLRPILNAAFDIFGEFYLEASEESNIKYRKIGCISCGIDHLTDLEIFKYQKAA